MKIRLVMTKGLPGASKSTWAKTMVTKHGYVRVNKDDLRSMLNESKWSDENEKFVLKVRDFIVTNALSSFKNVIVDDCNLAPKHEEALRRIADNFNLTYKGLHECEFAIQDFTDVPLQTCIERDLKRLNSVGKDVIMKMYNQYLKPKETAFELLKQPDGVVDAIICDIDGSIAKMKNRSPFDWHKVVEDEVVEHVKEIVRKFSVDHKILMVSGRDGICRQETKIWLDSSGIPYHELFMRDAGNNEKDYVIKERIYHEKIWPKYKVKFVIDDRPQVIRMWKNLGLNVLNVGDDVEF